LVILSISQASEHCWCSIWYQTCCVLDIF